MTMMEDIYMRVWASAVFVDRRELRNIYTRSTPQKKTGDGSKMVEIRYEFIT
jgi:hypothetical protein